MPHGQMGLNGPGIYVGLVILAVVLIGAIAVIVDSLRRPRYHFGKLGPWGYIAFIAFYFVLIIGMAIIRFTGLGAQFAGTLFLLFAGWTLLLGVIEIIYLLGVVFPDDKDREKRAAYEAEQGKQESSSPKPVSNTPHTDQDYFDE